MALEKFWAPVPWMLEAAIVFELALGKYVEAAIIALLLVFNAALGLLPEVSCGSCTERRIRANARAMNSAGITILRPLWHIP
jgi:hypothetical protein